MTGLRESVLRMRGYTPGEQINSPEVIKLNTNENPYLPSPKVFEAIQAALTGDALRKYPQPMGDDFRKAAGEVLGVDPDSILIGNGSDDILTILTRAFVPEGGLIAAPTPSYSLYKSLAEIQSAKFESVPFAIDGDHWALPHPWPHANANLTLVPNPNSPSGTAVSYTSLGRLAKQLTGPLVIDEAYADFAPINGLFILSRFPNLIITRSFSKYYALAGIRFGMAIASPQTIFELNKVKDSYNCDVLSLAAATAAIRDQAYYTGLRDKILVTKRRLKAELETLGFVIPISEANFLWCRHVKPVKPVYEALKSRNILIRYMSYEGYGDGLRISIGTDAEIDKLLEVLQQIVK